MNEERLNYIAGLEKAIKKKYGEETVQNPAKFWDDEKEKLYLQQLKDFVAKQRKNEDSVLVENVDGVLITRKLLNTETKFNCPECSGRIKTSIDSAYMLRHNCCQTCYIINKESRSPKKCQKKYWKLLEVFLKPLRILAMMVPWTRKATQLRLDSREKTAT